MMRPQASPGPSNRPPLERSSLLDRLRERPVAVWGVGASGQAVMDLIGRAGGSSHPFDERSGEGISRHFSAREAEQFPLVVYSPGFPCDHPWMETARAQGCLCLPELELAACLWSGTIIAVTGTNGKTTLTEFLAFALKRAGRDAVAAGNNGLPLSRIALTPRDGAVAVVEVSSFQAESLLHFAADALLWTNFSETHLDRHRTMEAYFRAKWNLTVRLRSPRFFADASVAHAAEGFGLRWPEGGRVVETAPRLDQPFPESSAFHPVAQRRNLRLAEDFWQEEGLPLEALLESARIFEARHHRLRKVAVLEGVSYWNDSKATNFAAVFGALDSFDHPVHWIGGGQYRGGDLDGFAARLAPRLKSATVCGETAPALCRGLARCGLPVREAADFGAAVREVSEVAEEGDSVLFSPGFASFDRFPGYAERGAFFEQSVLGLKTLPATP